MVAKAFKGMIQGKKGEMTLENIEDALTAQLNLMKMIKTTNTKVPTSYLCHLCFQKGHFIQDCPQVCLLLVLIIAT